MSKVLVAYERGMPTVSIMEQFFNNHLPLRDIEITFKNIKTIKSQDIDQCDILFFIRPNDIFSAKLAKKAKKSGCFVIFFCDDDLLNLPPNLPAMPWRKRALIRALKHSNLICSSSRYICQKYCSISGIPRFAILNTAVDSSSMKFSRTNQESDDGLVKLLYAASPSHVFVFNRYIMPIMSRLCERYQGKISMTFMGVRPDLSAYEQYIDVAYYSSMPLLEYRSFVNKGDYDIGLAPIEGDDFSKCKYFNKYLEYTMAGIVGVYTNSEPYTQVVTHTENGMLADNTGEAWFESLCTLIDDQALRERCLKNAQDQILTQFTPDVVVTQFLSDIPEMKSYSAERHVCKALLFDKVLYRFSRLLDWAYLCGFYLLKTGISGFIKHFKLHFRERKAYLKSKGE